MKKVLIITYYWPPSGGSGVQRWLKFVKYLRDYGWEPVVYTVAVTDPAGSDNSLLKDIPEGVEIIKKKIWEPYGIAGAFTGKGTQKLKSSFTDGTYKNSRLSRLTLWIRANFFIPDARKYWIKPSVSFLQNYLHKKGIAAIITTGPPHSMHLIGLELKKKLNIPWLADFRDPWVDFFQFKKLPFTKKALQKHHELQDEVLKYADAVSVTSYQLQTQFEKKTKKAVLITNGFDMDVSGESELDESFSISHIGLMRYDQNPENLWKVLEALTREKEDFKRSLVIRFVGTVSEKVKQSLKNYHLEENVEDKGYLPYDQANSYMRKSQLLLINNQHCDGVISGKTFEYMAAQRPILAIGSENSDMAHLLKETNTGSIFESDSYEALKTQIEEYFKKYTENRLTAEAKGIEKYSRKNLTGNLATVLNEISAKHK